MLRPTGRRSSDEYRGSRVHQLTFSPLAEPKGKCSAFMYFSKAQRAAVIKANPKLTFGEVGLDTASD